MAACDYWSNNIQCMMLSIQSVHFVICSNTTRTFSAIAHFQHLHSLWFLWFAAIRRRLVRFGPFEVWCNHKLTRNISKNTQHAILRTASPKRLSSMRRPSMYIESANPFDEYDMPTRFFNWAPIIISDVADVNALVTGTDIKSTIKPENINKPSIN